MCRNILLLIMLTSVFPIRALSQEEITKNDSLYTDFSDMSENNLNIQVKGFLDTYHAVRANGKGDWMSSRTRLRGEVSLEKENVGLFLSMNAIYNGILKDRTGLNLREAYLTYNAGDFNLRAGRQIIIWGNADALRVTDQISPMDYTEFLAQDYDDIRTPVNAFRVKYIHSIFSIEAICVPVSEFFLLSTDKHNPWAIQLSSKSPYSIDLESQKPSKRIGNMEFGGRVSFNLSGVDFAFCALHTWNKTPALSYSLSEKYTLSVVGNYRRMTMLGGDLSIPVGNFVLRGEAATFLNEAQNAQFGQKVKERNSLNGLVGVDWFPGNDWNLSIQYAHKYISGNLSGLAVLKNTGLATARISKELFRNTLSLSSFAYIDVTHGGIFNRFAAQYSINDQISITGGFDYFHADGGMFDMYKKNSEIWMKMKYSF